MIKALHGASVPKKLHFKSLLITARTQHLGIFSLFLLECLCVLNESLDQFADRSEWFIDSERLNERVNHVWIKTGALFCTQRNCMKVWNIAQHFYNINIWCLHSVSVKTTTTKRWRWETVEWMILQKTV